jgi:hypothetical protein
LFLIAASLDAIYEYFPLCNYELTNFTNRT